MENLPQINQQLSDIYGREAMTGLPHFKVVWSTDQLEKRLVQTTDTGVVLLHPEVCEVRKYGYVKDRYILERLTEVPAQNAVELVGAPFSYEPLWVFQDKDLNPLPFRFDVCEIVIGALYQAMGLGGNSPRFARDSPEEQKLSADRMYEELFGDETDVTDALTYKEAIVVPGYKKD